VSFVGQSVSLHSLYGICLNRHSTNKQQSVVAPVNVIVLLGCNVNKTLEIIPYTPIVSSFFFIIVFKQKSSIVQHDQYYSFDKQSTTHDKDQGMSTVRRLDRERENENERPNAIHYTHNTATYINQPGVLPPHCFPSISNQSLQKEVAYYQQEVKENQSKLNEMKQQNQNRFDIKKFQEVLDESHMMVPDSQQRLDQALKDLKEFLECHANEDTILSSEWYELANVLVERLNNSNAKVVESDTTVDETDVSNLQEGEMF
jgi:tubulin-specific chaperone A